MENTVNDFSQLTETFNLTVASTSVKPSYVSIIKLNGKPILPPLIDDEKRKELQLYKQKAIETERRIAKQKGSRTTIRHNQISSEVSSITNVPPSRQSTPARPASLNLTEKGSTKTFVLQKLRTTGHLSINDAEATRSEIISSHGSTGNLSRGCRSSLEQRLASEDTITLKNKLNKVIQSPITEERVSTRLIESDGDSTKESKRWSPLRIDSINSLKIELPTKDSQDLKEKVEQDLKENVEQGLEENVDMSLDESLNTPDTVTHSPSLMRQNSYTLLTPSPALLQFLETQKDQQAIPRSQSGRKTWDLNKARKDWSPKNGTAGKSSDEDACQEVYLNQKNSSSLESVSANQDNRSNDPEDMGCSLRNSFAYDSGTSPDSHSSKHRITKGSKIKCKFKGKKVRSTKSVPSPASVEKELFKGRSKPVRTSLLDLAIRRDNELPDVSNLLLQMKVDFELQKRQLEEKQQSEMKKLEIVFQRKEAELLNKVTHLPRKPAKSIYSHRSQESWHGDLEGSDPRMMGDGHQNRLERKENSMSEHCLGQHVGRRPHSAKGFQPQCCPHDSDCSRRARSMDFNQGMQDTDLDISFQDDFLHSKDTTLNNEYIIESDSISNFSSHSSSASSDNRQELGRIGAVKKFQGISSEEYAKYCQAASKINAGARGYLTRRLLRTAHVQGLITTLKDAITCATQLHTASDIADSDIDLMRRLSRQIEAAWEAVYAVFFTTETSTKLQLIATDRERLRAAVTKTPVTTSKKKRISSATRKSLDRKRGASTMSKSQTSNGFTRVRTCSKMAASYPSPYFPQKLK